MHRLSFVICLVLAVVVSSCGKKAASPAAPTPPGAETPQAPAATRIITITGSLAFGGVTVGSSVDRTIQISNSGNAALTVTALQATNGFTSASTASWTSGTIAAAASQSVTIRFTPTESKTYDGTLTVVADQTSGINTTPVTATGVAAATRIIGITGSLAFGSVNVGAFVDRTIQIANTGTGPLTVTGIQVTGGFSSVSVASWTSGTIASGASQPVTIRFTPTEGKAYDGTLTVTADHTGGVNTTPFSATGVVPGPKTSFGAGKWIVNTDIVAGRYFDSPSSGCYFERLSGLGGTFGEIIANDFIGFSAGQWIVDIPSSDRAFNTESSCNTWFKDSPRRGFQASISPGIWLVGSQVAPGLYRATVSAGCYWERLRAFSHRGIDDVLANDFVGSAGTQTIEVKAGDVGFSSDNDCGTWTPISGSLSLDGLSLGGTNLRGAMESNWERKRGKGRAR